MNDIRFNYRTHEIDGYISGFYFVIFKFYVLKQPHFVSIPSNCRVT